MANHIFIEAIAKAAALGLSAWLAWRIVANLRNLAPTWLRATGRPLIEDLKLRKRDSSQPVLDRRLSTVLFLHISCLLSLCLWIFMECMWGLGSALGSSDFAFPANALASGLFPADSAGDWKTLLAMRCMVPLLNTGIIYSLSAFPNRMLRSFAKTSSPLGQSFAREIALGQAGAAARAERAELDAETKHGAMQAADPRRL